MASAVYTLCALTSLACATLLLRAHAQSRARLLFWSALCFAGLALNNALVFVDVVLLPHIELFTARNLVALASASILLFGLIWDSH